MASAPIIEVSELAAEKLEEIMNEQGEESSLLRMMVVPGQQCHKFSLHREISRCSVLPYSICPKRKITELISLTQMYRLNILFMKKAL